MSETLSTEVVAITADELEAAYSAVAKLTRIRANKSVEWHVLMAARSIIHDALMLAQFGEVPGA